MVKKHILVIEDESSIADNITYALKSEGFAATWVSLGEEALQRLSASHVDLVILDVGLPDINGFEVCKTIRKNSEVPIIFLTARGEEIDRVVGLEIGGDDYVVKPFSPRELVARVKVILKRQRAQTNQSAASGQTFTLDEEKRQISYCNSQLELTAYEYGILKLLLSQPERVFTREQLMNAVWPTPEESFDRAVDTHIKTIRAKLRAVDPNDSSLVTHRGVGYSIQLRRVHH
ncbi:two-component system response regulator CreB [Thalassomonas actiniarum]|uniref:Two-component system response regulator CreB n=1 Tax=Thalassomonas actiniarum TaxID=485447 RepID=A0AAE9YTV6_9GAMM|nr:two-component system response regulator CreB [Thalassomonas actiniarum]WDD99407.1 two-component system response regulator CreB [Thalassomonas actiniarum]